MKQFRILIESHSFSIYGKYSKSQHFLPPVKQIFVSGGKKCLFFGKFSDTKWMIPNGIKTAELQLRHTNDVSS